MDQYISNEQFRKLSSQLHFDIATSKTDEVKTASLKAKLEALKHLRGKSILLEINESSKEKGL